MKKTTLSVPKMDCAAEERLIRMVLEGRSDVHRLEADLAARKLLVIHEGEPEQVAALVRPLNLGGEILETTDATELDEVKPPSGVEEARTLKIVLAINAGMFAGEFVGALLADSSALLADSLDMFADAAVYGIALFGVHRAGATQLKAARVSGVLQLLLAAGALAEVVRRVVFGSEPEAPLMIAVALVALAANVTCMWLLARHRAGGAHMKASWIFTTNDVIANVGVIVAAVLVRLLNSPLPDLVVATLIALVVLNGAIRILRLKGQDSA
jgi:Co/Zn/Cd efflux system component